MDALWRDTVKMPTFDALEKDVKTDVLIIGGGMAGILCTYMLQRAGMDCVLAEAANIAGGITQHTTAKITVQHGLLYDQLIRTFDEQTAQAYYQANTEAVQQFRRMCATIDCDFEEQDHYVYTLHRPEKIERELHALQTIGAQAEFCAEFPFPFPTDGGIRFPHQAQFHPLKFLAHIAKDLPIYEHTPVRELVGTTARTDHGRIRAKNIVVTTHFPFLNKHGNYFLKLHQQRSYVIALEHAPSFSGMYIDEAENGMSFRHYQNVLLVGGGGHRTGKTGGGWEELRRFAAKAFPNATEKYHWATQDCMTLDGIPYIGRYSAQTEGLYVATGFNKWGMTGAMVAAQLLTDLLCGETSRYAAVFDPSRTILRKELVTNAWESMINLLTPTVPRCPHLGCALKWNPYEHTWDCPCHGSRFAENGTLLDNPATGNIRPHPHRTGR